MQRKTFLRLCLLLPYLALGVSALITIPFIDSVSFYENWFLAVLGIFTVSAIVWGPLYTWMAIVLWIWSIGRSEREVRRAYYLSPFILAGAMGVPTIAFSANDSAALFLWNILHRFRLEYLMPNFFPYFSVETPLIILVALLMMGGLSVMIGYVFVGIVFLIERALLKRNYLITDI